MNLRLFLLYILCSACKIVKINNFGTTTAKRRIKTLVDGFGNVIAGIIVFYFRNNWHVFKAHARNFEIFFDNFALKQVQTSNWSTFNFNHC